MKRVQIREVIFIGVEGASEQSFFKWLDILVNAKELPVHLNIKNLSGGGYQSMLNGLIKHTKSLSKSKSQHKILIVDTDRALEGTDGWSLNQLKENAKKHNIEVLFQKPNFEGLLIRLFKGWENSEPKNKKDTEALLLKLWPGYNKPKDAESLKKKFLLADLLRASHYDNDLKRLLDLIGLQEH